jgi:hypothetical protein
MLSRISSRVSSPVALVVRSRAETTAAAGWPPASLWWRSQAARPMGESAICGEDYRDTLDRVLPRAFGEALGEADLFFQSEMPAVQAFTFTADDIDGAEPDRRGGRTDGLLLPPPPCSDEVVIVGIRRGR